MDLGLADKRAAVAAASSGLGLGAAEALAAEGAHVVICGRDEGRIQAAAARIGHGAVPFVFDVGSPEGATGFVEAALAELGGLDVLVTNAGGPRVGTFATTTVADYPHALALNLLSVVAMCEAAVPAMRRGGWGRIVAITSISVRQPIPNLILSNTARAGATGFLKTLAREVAIEGITVNSVQPGLHATERLVALQPDGDLSGVAATIPAGELGDATDFGKVVAFLCSVPARFITGAHLQVDGGSYAGLL
jgi:3-oxoacyl-[acyl-carrier protein] reductase